MIMDAAQHGGQAQRNQRREYFIKKPFQTYFIFQYCSLIILGCVLLAGALYYYSGRTLTTAFVDSRLKVMSTAEFLFPAFGLAALAIVVAVTFLAAMRLMFFSHKIAGPIYRLEKSAEGVKAGELGINIRLRSKDELQDLARTMDEMVTDLRDRIHKIRQETQRLRAVTAQANNASLPPQELLKELGDIQNKLDEQVDHFRG
jgi:methyl-accepting chemotaxis protein